MTVEQSEYSQLRSSKILYLLKALTVFWFVVAYFNSLIKLILPISLPRPPPFFFCREKILKQK